MSEATLQISNVSARNFIAGESNFKLKFDATIKLPLRKNLNPLVS